MPDRHEIFQVTCPANTPKTAPVEVQTRFNAGHVRSIEVHWPRGHVSLTGIQIACAHQQLVPFTVGAYIFGNNQIKTYEPKDPPESGQWSVFLYNTDNRPHYWQITYNVDNLVRRIRGTFAVQPPLLVGDIYNAWERA